MWLHLSRVGRLRNMEVLHEFGNLAGLSLSGMIVRVERRQTGIAVHYLRDLYLRSQAVTGRRSDVPCRQAGARPAERTRQRADREKLFPPRKPLPPASPDRGSSVRLCGHAGLPEV